MKLIKQSFVVIEMIFWSLSAAITIVGALGMLAKASYALYLDFSTLKTVLAHEIFYSVIAFELFQMARVRIEKRSHTIVLYHFIFMSTLTLGREIFLIHNLDIWIILGFSLMILVYVLYWIWQENDKAPAS